MLLRPTAQCTAMTKQGSCAFPHIPLACSMNADQPAPPPTTDATSPPKHYQASLTGTIPPPTPLPSLPLPTLLYVDRLPTSAAVHLLHPLTTLRNHHPCPVQADPAILSATVKVSWSGASGVAAATV